MDLKNGVLLAALAGALMAVGPTTTMAGPSGANVRLDKQGHLGEVTVNPYKIAPLTAIIRSGGYTVKDVTVRIVPKKGGQEIKYQVDDNLILTHGGIPVFGLYADYNNKVEVSYTRIFNGKAEKFDKQVYKVYAPPVYMEPSGSPDDDHAFHDITVKKVDPEFKDRLYLVNNIGDPSTRGVRTVWNNPTGGALEWNMWPINTIIDTQGEVRWYMFANPIFDLDSIYNAGIMMGFQQDKKDGTLTWGYGQRLAKYDIMGREIWNRRLPLSYADFSHSLDKAQNGHYFARVSSADYRRLDGKRVHTVRDVIAEIDENGEVVDEWKLMEILDQYRDDVIKAMDQGAVCLNIDASKAGQTMSAEDLAQLDQSEKFGDIPGTGAGRNWAHVNSVDYDPTDDSIIISSRHQSAIIKIGRDKKVKWILGAPKGWKGDYAKKLLKPVDKNGKPIACTSTECEGEFDWTYTQHTAFRVDEKSDKRYIYVTAFDNGDARHLEQPALPGMKYSRAVIYRIDQKNMTVEQVWQYGKERGHEWYSPVTSLTRYEADKNSVMVYSATANAPIDPKTGAWLAGPNPCLNEFKWGASEPSVEIHMRNITGYQAIPFSVEKAFKR